LIIYIYYSWQYEICTKDALLRQHRSTSDKSHCSYLIVAPRNIEGDGASEAETLIVLGRRSGESGCRFEECGGPVDEQNQILAKGGE
jgi:hypothetical protein